jgi:hypothetical protein
LTDTALSNSNSGVTANNSSASTTALLNLVNPKSLLILSSPAQSSAGVAVLELNQAVPVGGRQLEIPLPKELTLSDSASVTAISLPSWLSYNPTDKALIVHPAPSGVVSAQVIFQVNDSVWNLNLEFKHN